MASYVLTPSSATNQTVKSTLKNSLLRREHHKGSVNDHCRKRNTVNSQQSDKSVPRSNKLKKPIKKLQSIINATHSTTGKVL